MLVNHSSTLSMFLDDRLLFYWYNETHVWRCRPDGRHVTVRIQMGRNDAGGAGVVEQFLQNFFVDAWGKHHALEVKGDGGFLAVTFLEPGTHNGTMFTILGALVAEQDFVVVNAVLFTEDCGQDRFDHFVSFLIKL